ncbi:MAG: hypothetical protein DMG69_13770 [Acidobacteria bacterium]|nr:MAG: hypothetical protein DMG69_13770 [Acidobacteriota bacterium]
MGSFRQRELARWCDRILRAAALILALSLSLAAQTLSVAPGDLVRQTADNELKAAGDNINFMFRSRRETPHGSQTKLFVQTRDATAGLLIAINDRPLSQDQRRAEEARLESLVSDPDELRRKQKQEKEDADRVSRIMRALPNAFIYEYDGIETGRPGIGKQGDELVRLKFRPNPKFDPPSRVEQVLTGMRGYLLIDANQHRIAKIDGSLYKEVSFGWGILGHLDKGGQFQVEQASVGDGDIWQITRMSLNFTGKLLLFRSLVIKSNETFSDFRRVRSDLTFAQGVDLLKREESASALNRSGE